MRGIYGLIEIVSVAGMVGLFAFVPLTKLSLAAILTFVGAFFPKFPRTDTNQEGNAEIKVGNIGMKVSGGLRLSVIMCGLALFLFAMYETLDTAQTYERLALGGNESEIKLIHDFKPLREQDPDYYCMYSLKALSGRRQILKHFGEGEILRIYEKSMKKRSNDVQNQCKGNLKPS
jgi:hypothetical protein